MKVNKMIYIELTILQDMEKYCKDNNIKISKLIEELWKAFRKTNKR